MKINFIYSPDVSLEQMMGYEMAAIMWGQLFTDDIQVNILAKSTDQLDANVIGGAIPEFHEQHYALFLQYFEADITSAEDQAAYDALQQGNTIDFLLNGELIGGNTKLKLTTALAKALGMEEAISLDRYVLDDSANFLDGTIMMNQNFTWDFNYLRDSEAAENTLDFLSVALHETGHILGFTSSLDFTLQQETLYSGRTELSNFSPLDLFRFSAASLAQNNPDGSVNDLSVGGVAWFSLDGGETLGAKMSTGKTGDGYQASHWERRYDPLGIMDPTLWYQERASITDLDVLAFDIMGYDLAANAGEVEQLFTTEGLELALAQAKVNLADKLGVSVQWLEDNAVVPVSSLDLIAQIETALAEATTTDTSTTETTTTDPSSETTTTDPSSETTTTDTSSDTTTTDTSSDDEEVKDFIKDLGDMMKNTYKWWSQSSGSKGSSWQELYEWWSQNSGSKGSSWQELYEWWAQQSGNKGSSWQELYEWWAQNSGSKGSSWQELYEWWSQDSGKKGSWWQQVFFASQDETNLEINLENIKLPGETTNTIDTIYTEITGGSEDDIIAGDISNNNIVAGAGDDLIDGAEGDDTIAGGEGFDTIFGFDGNDSILGGDGDDVISGESDNDVLLGEGGDDVIMGGDHDDYLDGGAGRDFLNGNTGHDVLVGRSGDDALEGEAGKDLLIGGEGQDIGNGGSGDDFIFGDDYSASLQQAFGENVNSLINLFTPNTDTTTDTTTTTETNNVVLGLDPLKVEAENMTLSGNYSLASNGTLVRTNSNTARLSTIFNGEAGKYNIVIGYHDVYGNARINASLGTNTIDNWYLNQTTGNLDLTGSNFKTRTIASEVSLNGGESLVLDTTTYVSYSGDDDDSAGIVYDKAYIDYVEFVPIVENNVVLAQDPVRLEAETMSWTGDYKVEQKTYASGGELVGPNADNQWIYGNTTFTEESGVYNIVIGYHDIGKIGETKYKEGQIRVKVNGNVIDNWKLDDVNFDAQLMAGNFTKYTIDNVQLNQGDTFGVDSLADFTPEGFIDYIEFVRVETSTNTDTTNTTSTTNTDTTNTTNTNTTTNTSSSGVVIEANSDILRGGNGNDGIDGGIGNDIIFGEDELNDSSNIAPLNIDGSFTYGQSTYLLTETAMTWAEAQAVAESMGGNLVTINDAAEHQWLKDTFGTTEALFIGMSDAETEGTWKWASGQPVTYTDWAPNEPNDYQGNQDYAILSHIWNANTDKWDDVTNGASFRGIIEIDWSSVGGNDTILGGAGDDQIYGNSGNDKIYGDNADIPTITVDETLSFQQGVNGYTGTVDTQLHGYYWTTNYGNATSLGVDGYDLGYPVHSLIKFEDIFGSSASQIATNATINSAILEINVSNPGNGLKVHELLKNWSESSTWRYWDNQDNGVSANGVEAKSTPVATTNWVSTGILKIDVTKSLKAWQADPTKNYGWAFLPTGNDGVDFGSSEGANAPRLVVDVTQETSASASGEGHDNITGNGGNDTISGGAGDDIINGTDEIVAGYYEIDILNGGAGADKFILGDTNQAYYATAGYQDYAVIEDFDSSVDTIQFYGSASDYQQQQQGNDLFLSRNGDLVAILENTNSVNLSGSGFEYLP